MPGILSKDRQLSVEVRRLALSKIKIILEQPRVDMTVADRELHDAILLKLAQNAIPRMTEVSGEDGEPIQIKLVNYADADHPIQVSATSVSDTAS